MRRVAMGAAAAATLVLLASLSLGPQQALASKGQAAKQAQGARAPDLAAGEALARKSIVFDLKTPKVFYCPQDKANDLNQMIVKARPLDSLCEFGGKPKPRSAPSDCYNDVDETELACDEKKRFMIRLDLASEGLDPAAAEGAQDAADLLLAKASAKKKAAPRDKKY